MLIKIRLVYFVLVMSKVTAPQDAHKRLIISAAGLLEHLQCYMQVKGLSVGFRKTKFTAA